MRVLARLLRWTAWAALGLVAALGVSLATFALLAVVPATRPAIATALVKVADEAIAGRLELEGVEVLSRGGVEIRGLEVFDPEDRLVLSVGRAAVFVDVTGIAARAVGLTVELDHPSVLLEEAPDGTPSLVRAFEPAGGPAVQEPGEERAAGPTWSVHVSRVTVRGGDVWWVDAAGKTRLQAQGLDLDASGLLGSDRARAELRLEGELADPIAAPVLVELSAASTGRSVRVSALRAKVGGTSLAAVAEGDLDRRSGRLAISRLGIDREDVRAVAPGTPAGDDLHGFGYAASDGEVASAAFRVEPATKGAPGRVDAAAAARLAPETPFGFDVALDRVDPARLIAGAPSGDVNLEVRGAASGGSLAELRGRVAVTVDRTRIRRGAIERVELRATADRGALLVERATASAPGLALRASLRWKDGADVSGSVLVDGADLSAAVENLGRLLGESLPPASGRARLEGSLEGTAEAPALAFSLDAPRAAWAGVSAAGARLSGEVTGPLERVGGKVEGRVAALRSDGTEVATAVSISGSLAEDAATVLATATLPGFRDPATIEARGRFGAGRESLLLSRLSFGYPGARWDLEAPASVTLAGPAVDRLSLSAGAQRISLEGGIGSKGALDARLEVERIDLATIPAGLLPEDRLGGEVSGIARATGTVARPDVEATAELAGASIRSLKDVSARAAATWRGAARRATLSLASSLAGGVVDLHADLPFPIAGRPKEQVRVQARLGGVRLRELAAVAASGAAVEGVLSVEASLEGTAGMPTFRGKARLHDAEIEEIEALAIDVEVEEPGQKLRVTAGAAIEAQPFLTASAEVPLDLASLLARPSEAAARLAEAPLAASATLVALDLSRLEGRAGLPDGIGGILEGDAAIEGTLVAPRGEIGLELARAAWAGYRDLSGGARVTLGAQAVAITGRLAVGGEEALRLAASLGAPPERIDSLDALRAVPVRVTAEIPRLALARASPDVPLSGVLEAKLEAAGTPGAPEGKLALSGEGVEVEGRKLGDVRLEATYGGARLSAETLLRPASGGELRATFGLEAALGLGAEGPIAEAPAEATVFAEALHLGFLPALAPGVVRAGDGTLAVALRAKGPLARLSPRGTLRVNDGRLSVSEFGDFTGIAVEANVTDDAVEVPRVEVRRGAGKLSASAFVRGLRSDQARLEAHLSAEDFTVTRAGSDFATFDLQVEATGKQEGKVLSLDATVPRGVVRLPAKAPRDLQSLERRADIVVGRRELRRRREAPATMVAGPPEEPYRLVAHLAVPRGFFVKGDDPRVDLELKADLRYELIRSRSYVEGLVEVVRGEFEPIGGRKFVVERGRVQFTGGAPEQALLDFQARYDNPSAVVSVRVQGPLIRPEIQLSSQPPMDDGQIAMLIATGRTELKAGSGGVGTLTGEEAGRAALGVLATQAFKNLVADKLPLDTVALDSSAIRAGKYLTDKIYVAYTRHLEADPEKGENVDEVRVEYQITPRWTFESRYGSAQSGGASLIWSKDY